MKVLKFNQYYLTLLGISSNRLSEPVNEFWHFISNYALVLGLVGFMLFGSLIYAFQHFDHLTLALRAVLLMCGSMQCIGSYISIGRKMTQVKQLQLTFQEFIDRDVKPSEMPIYSKTEENCRKFTQFISVGYLLMAAVLFAAASLYSTYCMFRGNYRTESWLLPYNLYVAFDTSTIQGWYLFWLIQCYVAFAYSLVTTCSTTYYVSCCLYIVAVCNHFNASIQSLSVDIERNLLKGNEKKICGNFIARLNNIVELHSKIFEISKLFSNVCSGLIFWMLSMNIVFFASALYQMEHTIGSLNLMIMYDFLCLIVSLLWPFALCYGATLVSAAGFSTGESLYNSNWYIYPPNLQKHIPFILERSQREIILSGFNFIECNLEKFITMNKSASSFYLMFRNVAKR